MDHPYCYPGTAVYRNKWGIRDKDQLAVLEQLETLTRMDSLPRNFPVTVKGYSRIHAWLFHNIYDWAGQNRFVDTGRAGSPFCRAQFIAPEMAKRFAAIHAENSLRGSHRDAFATRAGEHACELNAIHPFLDGNGRTLRGFLETLALQAGHELDIARISPNEWNRASVIGFQRSDYRPMRDVIAGALA